MDFELTPGPPSEVKFLKKYCKKYNCPKVQVWWKKIRDGQAFPFKDAKLKKKVQAQEPVPAKLEMNFEYTPEPPITVITLAKYANFWIILL